MTILRQRLIQDLKIRNYSPRTIDVYVDRVARFARHFGKSPDQLGPSEIREFQVFLVETKKASWAQLNQTVCALRFFYKFCLDKPWMIEHIPLPKQVKKLPVVLSCQEVSRLLAAAGNLKHRTLLVTLYATGVRLAELVALQVSDIDSSRMLLRVSQGKGRRDRYVPLAETLLGQLRFYWRKCRPKGYLFAGKSAGSALSPSAVQRVCKTAALKAGLSKTVSPHVLRHCFAGKRNFPSTVSWNRFPKLLPGTTSSSNSSTPSGWFTASPPLETLVRYSNTWPATPTGWPSPTTG